MSEFISNHTLQKFTTRDLIRLEDYFKLVGLSVSYGIVTSKKLGQSIIIFDFLITGTHITNIEGCYPGIKELKCDDVRKLIEMSLT